MTTKNPKIEPRFIYNVRRFDKNTKKFIITPQLNADGHIDYAYQVGIGAIITEIVESKYIENADGGNTHWVTVKATIITDDGRTVTGLASSNSRTVTEPGFEVMVAETRALKRAIAVGYNITEKIINPSGTVPTREIVDIKLDDPEPEHEIPPEVKKSPEDIVSDAQFEV